MPDLIYLNGDLDSAVQRVLDDGDLASCGLTKTKITRTLKSFQGDEIACSVFLKKYAVRDDANKIVEYTLEEAKDRWANCVASAESKFKKKYSKIRKDRK